MVESETNYIKTTDIIRRAFMQASGVIADEDRQSFPIPVLQDGEHWIIFLFSPSLARPQKPTELSPPGYLIQLNARTGKLKKLLTVTPVDFKQKHKADETIGELIIPAELNFEEFILKRNRLYVLYDELLPAFFTNCKIEDASLAAYAIEFQQLFKLLSELPLWPYYRAAGTKFFDWVTQKEN